mgnify:CR=1 FL=1
MIARQLNCKQDRKKECGILNTMQELREIRGIR